MNKNISIGVIISTYNNPEWLKKTLWGYTCQTYSKFELIIADDGSDNRTKRLIEFFRNEYFPQIKHVWHPDNGFEKTKILNKAIVASESEYLIFTDQDCIPRGDFVKNHLNYAQPGYFLSGGYFKLPMNISNQIKMDDIITQNVFECKWLRKNDLQITFKSTKLIKSSSFSRVMNFITPAKASWNGCNSSGWKSDMLAINGFNEEMEYGGEDREFGERLLNMGIKSKQLRYSLIVVHLDHERPYKNDILIQKNREIRKNVKVNHIIRTSNGIEKDC